tara:strand:- start:624 stop:2459 length:1836 start_codon:yes stop_codon:yes gene_type:complete
MKKNFLITADLIDAWEFDENNFLLGKWCDLDVSSKEKLKNKIPKRISIIKNSYHWENSEKKVRDYKYLKNTLDYLLELISENLSIIHDVNENKEYWRIIVFTWLSEYTATIFDRWESIRIFFEKYNTEKFYSNFILLNDLDYISKNHVDFRNNSRRDDEWNHLIFLRLFYFLNIQNLSLVEKKNIGNNLKGKSFHHAQNLPLTILVIKAIDNIISKFAFKFNKIIFDSFYFPKKEYLKICLRCKLIPGKYLNFFNFHITDKNLSKDNNEKRIKLKDLLSKIDYQDKFIQFLLLNIHKDMPKSYLENFNGIKKRILPLAKEKKVIFSMHSIEENDNFKIYIAETKKAGSKFIHAEHGGGLGQNSNAKTMSQYFNFLEKVSDKIIRWDNTEQKQDIYKNLSPTLPIIKLKKLKSGDNCSIIFFETVKYLNYFPAGPTLNQMVNFFNELTQFVNKLDPEIKSKIKFRVKANFGYNAENFFSEMFGKNSIDKVSLKNTFKKTLLNSKLVIVTHPETVLSEAMYANVPTILIMKKSHWLFSKTALDTFDDLKKNKIAFEDFNEAKIHVNKYWKNLDLWWESKNVQLSRDMFLKNFFNVKLDWFKEWSDYIYFSSKL